jgi:hypothetical protein
MGKPSRRGESNSTKASAKAYDRLLILSIPSDLLPPASDELRWQALHVHCNAYAPLYMPPEKGVVAWPPMVVPAAEILAYASGKFNRLSPRFHFFRTTLLLLVGRNDMLHSVVNTGRCTGVDIMSEWNEALDQVLLRAATLATDDQERALIEKLMRELRRGRHIDVLQARLRRFGRLCFLIALIAIAMWSLNWPFNRWWASLFMASFLLALEWAYSPTRSILGRLLRWE